MAARRRTADDLRGAGEVAALVRYAQAVLAGHIIPSRKVC